MDAIDGSILQEVEKQLDDMRLGFSLRAEDRAVPDRPHLASKQSVLQLEDKLPVDVRNDLFRIAKSPLYAKAGMRKAEDFWEVASVLGPENIKAYIFSSALFGMANVNKDIRDLKNKSRATARLSIAIVHDVLGVDRAIMHKVQLCSLVRHRTPRRHETPDAREKKQGRSPLR